MPDFAGHHMVAIPHPGRGHINPMMNLCKLIALRRPSDFLITFVVTEEWLGFIGSDPKPANIRFATIPNVIPSELNRGADFAGFVKAVLTKLEDPVEQLLHRLEVPATMLIYDTYLVWVFSIGKRMNIPVASFFPMSATVFMSYHTDLLLQVGLGDNFSEKSEEEVDPTRVADLVTDKELMQKALKAILMASKAAFLLFPSVYELEAQVIDALKSEVSVPVYAVGPAIPYFEMNNVHNTPDYLQWLNHQPKASVLYISQGSFASVSNAQLDEVIGGVHESGVRFMWVARGETSRFKHENGLVVSWCDQLRVLCHGSVGAFWSHCGWNSVKEAAFSGVPMLTFPIAWDQVPNSKMIVDNWKMGRRVMMDEGILVTRGEIAKLIKNFMAEDGKEIRERAKEVKEICRQATSEGGSAQINIDSFINHVLNSRNN